MKQNSRARKYLISLLSLVSLAGFYACGDGVTAQSQDVHVAGSYGLTLTKVLDTCHGSVDGSLLVQGEVTQDPLTDEIQVSLGGDAPLIGTVKGNGQFLVFQLSVVAPPTGGSQSALATILQGEFTRTGFTGTFNSTDIVGAPCIDRWIVEGNKIGDTNELP